MKNVVVENQRHPCFGLNFECHLPSFLTSFMKEVGSTSLEVGVEVDNNCVDTALIFPIFR